MRHLAPIVTLFLTACASNPYGYAPEYVPLSEEEEFHEQGHSLSYEEVRRDPAGHAREMIAWFGVVESVQAIEGSDETLVAMQLHFHQPRHLCADQFDSSCRVTVSEKERGPFSARVALRPEDTHGKDRVYAGSLLKIYGHATSQYDERGGPILDAVHYRHWPRGTYVTTARRVNMRR